MSPTSLDFAKLRPNPQTITKQSNHKKTQHTTSFLGIESPGKSRKMSVASSPIIPCIKTSPCSSSPSSSSSSSFSLRFSSYKPYCVTIRSSQTEGPLRRPVAQPLKPKPPSPPSSPPSPPSTNVAPLPKAAAIVGDDKNVVTMEFQRQKAKELQDYFKQKKLEEAERGPLFGFIGKNELTNGRWAMFGFAVGMLTEYATGSDLVDQVKILLSNFGIIDLE